MSSIKYTLDRYEGDYAIFLMAENETVQKIIHRTELKIEVAEGEIVLIEDQPPISVKRLPKETKQQQQRVNSLLEKLKNKK